jgi:Tfp pilus assembly protein PilN
MKGAVSINLASQPFRRDRPFQVAALAGSAFLAGLFLWQAALGSVERRERAELLAGHDQANRQLALLQAERTKLDAAFRKPENAEAIEYALFLNGLILRKSISWTKIFSDLEQVIPHNVRLVNVRPQVNLDNQIQLDMTVASGEPLPVIDMLKRLEGSPLFGAATVTSWLPPSQSEALYRYRVNVNYAPKI